MKLLRSLFGSRADDLEDKGDDLRLGGFWREATWFYGQALAEIGDESGARRERLEARAADVRTRAFTQLAGEARKLARRGLSVEALKSIRDADEFASRPEETALLADLREEAEGNCLSDDADGGAAGARRAPAPFDVLMKRLPETEADWLISLGPDGRAGYIALQEGRIDDAVAALSRETGREPDSGPAHDILARSLERAGRFEEAREHYDIAYLKAPDRYTLILDACRLLKGVLDDAPASLDRIEGACRRHRATAENLELHLERAFLLADCGRPGEAVEITNALLERDGLDHSFLLFNRAGFLEADRREEEAENDLVEALKLSPSNLLYLERLADLWFRLQGDPERILEILDRALDTDAHDFSRPRGPEASPDRARLQYKASRVLFIMDRVPEARARIDEALVICTDPRVEEALLDLRRTLAGESGADR